MAEQRDVGDRDSGRGGNGLHRRGKIEPDEIIERPARCSRRRRCRIPMTAKIEDEHVEACVRERGGKAVVAAGTKVATVGHHGVQAEHNATARAHRGDSIDRQLDAIGRGRLQRRERHCD